MQNSVNERIKILVDQLAMGNKSSFARSIGISNQSLGEIIGGRQSAPSFAALQKVFTSFPQVRMEWLILGTGPMLRSEESVNSLEQTRTALSAEQLDTVKREVRNLIINRLGLDQAEERQAKEAQVRAEHITALEVKTRTLKMRMDELTAQRQLLESKADMSDQDKEQIASMRNTYMELSNDLYGSSQVLFTLQAEEKRDLREAHALIGEMTQAVQAALKPTANK